MQLVLNNIVSFIKSNRIIFIVFVVCQIITCFTAQYVCTVFYSKQHANIDDNTIYKTFYIDFHEPIHISEIIEKLSRNEDIKKISLYNDDFMITADYNKYENKYVIYGRYFEKDEFFTSESKVVLNTADEGYKIGNTFFIDGHEYEIIGINWSNQVYNEVTYQNFIENYSTTQISVEFLEIPTLKQIKETSNHISSIMPNSVVYEPENVNFVDYFTGSSEYIISICIVVLSILNISYLYTYVLSKRKRLFCIYRLCGASSKKVEFLLLLEIVVISLFIYIISSIALHLFVAPNFAELNGNLVYAYSFAEYFITCIFYQIIILVVFGKCIKSFIKGSIKELL